MSAGITWANKTYFDISSLPCFFSWTNQWTWQRKMFNL